MPRCFGDGDDLCAAYHDHEWGVPAHDDTHLFEMLVLEGAQAGLSWQTVLHKREGYRRVFHGFGIERVAVMTDDELATALTDPGIVRNRLKVAAARTNARVALDIIAECGSLDEYLWAFVEGQPVVNHFAEYADVPASTPLSTGISKDLKQRDMTFVGPTIMYAFMQAVGMVDDHLTWCCKRTGEPCKG